MIPKGNLHGNGGRLADYLVKGQDGEQAELIEMRGFASDNLREAFCDIQAIAESQTRCQKPFFHAYVRLAPDESLAQEQWLETANRIEQKLGFDDQPRAVALHFLEDGTTHLHVAWSRIDTDTMKAIDPGLYLRKMKEVCRELESEFGLRELSSNLPLERQTGAARRPEFEEARRLDVDVTATREIIRTCYDQSDNGPSFAAALAEHGLSLARGDRRDFVAIDGEGGQHALSKRICGATAEEIRGRLGEEFKRTLPTVDEARQQLEAQRETQQAATPQTARRSLTDRTEIASEVSALWAASDTGQSFAASLDERGYVLARGDRRDFVLIDSDGNHFALARLIDGARAADVRAKLNDIDAGSLPSVSEARAEVEARAAARKKPPEPVAQREAAPDVPAVSASRDAPDVSADATAGIEITPPDPTEIVDGAARGFSKILGAALGAVARSAEQLVGLLDGLTGGSKPEPQRGPPEPPPEAAHDSPPAPGQMPDPSANLTDEARNEAVARWLAQTQDEMRGGQDEKDRRARDDDEEYGIERPR